MTSTASIFMDGIRLFPLDNQPTGLFKSEIVMPAWLGKEGLSGDAQADHRVHGGPEKALHQYPVTHYTRLAATPGMSENWCRKLLDRSERLRTLGSS